MFIIEYRPRTEPLTGYSPQKNDLLAPEGNWDDARAAVGNGALYLGLGRLNVRMRADSSTAADLPALMA